VIVGFNTLMMLDLVFIISTLLFSFLCLIEVVVFDEEILLAACFFCFVFFMFNSVGNSVFNTLSSRATKFEVDLLVSFGLKKNGIEAHFQNFLLSRSFSSKFSVLFTLITQFLTKISGFSAHKFGATLYYQSVNQLTSLLVFENKLIAHLQKKSTSLLFYPLIFQTAKKNVKPLANLSFKNDKGVSCSILKGLT
jgi:hypothetical protein